MAFLSETYQGIKINKFDVIKLGRMKFRIKELVCAEQEHDSNEIMQQDLKEAHQVTFMEPNVDEEGKELCQRDSSSEKQTQG